MVRAIERCKIRTHGTGGTFLAVNADSNQWNNQVKTLAEAIAEIIPRIKIRGNPDSPADKRSYKVNLDLFGKLALNHQPVQLPVN